jgi:hypothetical protein
MNKKLLAILGGSALSAMLLAGCNADQEPPPEDNESPVEEEVPGDNDGMNEGGDNGDMDMDTNDGEGNISEDNNGDIDDNENGEGPVDEMEDEMTDEENNNE